MNGKRYALLAALALIGGLIGGTASSQFFMNMPSNIRAKKIQIQDQEGKTRIELSTLPDGSPGLSLADKNGKIRVMLAVWGLQDKLPSLSFNDKDGDRRIVMTVRPDGMPYIAFADTNKTVIWTAP